MSLPPFLKPGSTIAIVATARTANEKEIQLSKKILEEQGFNIVLAPNISLTHNRFAGDDEARIEAFQNILDDTTIDAIWLARGGYGTVRIMDHLNWTRFIEYPKWLIGFSDFTLVHLKLGNLNIASIHACTFVQVQKFGIAHENVITTLEILLNQARKYEFSGTPYNKTGTAEGILTGGNLSMICNSIGTPTQINTSNCILLLEDCDEYLYHYDRLLHQLKRAGILENLSGLIVGESTFKPEPDDIDFGLSITEMVLDICREYHYPICFSAPFGHAKANYALCLNTPYSLKVAEAGVTISQV